MATDTGRARAVLIWTIRLAVLAGLVLAGRQLGDLLSELLSKRLAVDAAHPASAFVGAAIMIYIILMALPFVPGVEIGLGLMLMFGPPVVPVVYVATVVSLTLAFAVGRFLPQDRVIAVLRAAGMPRIAARFEQLRPLPASERTRLFFASGPGRLESVAMRFRYLGLAVLINLPGNSIIGGGGGLSLMAGFSRLFRLPAFLLTVAVAILPVPLFFFFWR